MKTYAITIGNILLTIPAENMKEAEQQADFLNNGRESVTIHEITPKTTYYLFGTDAIRELGENGVEGVVKEFEGSEIDFGTFEFKEGITESVDFIFTFGNWSEYAIITEEEYNKLNS